MNVEYARVHCENLSLKGNKEEKSEGRPKVNNARRRLSRMNEGESEDRKGEKKKRRIQAHAIEKTRRISSKCP